MKKYFYLLPIMIGWLGMTQQASAVCREEMFFTEFASTATAPTPYHTIANGTVIREYKSNGNNVVATFTPKVPYASAANQVGTATGGYGVVRSSTDVNTGYTNANVPMIIFPFGANYSDLLSLELTGLDVSESYIVTVKARVVYRSGCPGGGQGSFGVFAFRDEVGKMTQFPTLTNTNGIPTGETSMMAIAQSDPGGKLSITLLSGYNSQSCIAAIGFTSIEVIGCPLIAPVDPGTPRPDPCSALTTTPPNPCDVASATIFEAGGDWNAKSRYVGDVRFIGGEGTLVTSLPKGGKSLVGVPDVTGRVYSVVSNPRDINPNFPDIDKPMILLPTRQTMGAVDANLLQYLITGLAPSKQYDIIIEGYFITSGCTTLAGTSQLGLCVNGTGTGTGTCTTPAIPLPTTANPVTCFTLNTTCTTSATNSSIDLIIRTAGTVAGTVGLACEQVYGITKIEIKGSSTTPTIRALTPKVVSSQDEEVCRNELIRFSLDKNYNACSYKWEKSLTGAAGTWNPVGTNQNYMEEVSGNAYYRCTINEGRPGGYGVSDPFYLAVIDCCNEEDGGSRITLFYDDFGKFLSNTSYVTITGETIPTCNGMFRSVMDPAPVFPAGVNEIIGTKNMPGVVFFRSQTNPCLYQGNLSACRPANPGNIGIVAVPDISAHYCSTAGCLLSIFGNADASGNTNGGVLMFDVADCKLGGALEIYRRRIDNLCGGKMTYFQVDYAPLNIQTANNDKVTLSIYARNPDGSKSATPLASTTSTGLFYRWQTFKLKFEMPEGYSSIYICIEYTQPVSSSGDFMIDNVKFMVCTQPIVDGYSNIETLQQDTTICGDAILNLGSRISDKVINAYGGSDKVRVIYQYSTDNADWKNITGITSDLSKKVDMKDYPETRTYFRIVIANDAALQKFLINPNAEEYANPCRTTSIAQSFMIFREGNMNVGPDERRSECKGSEVTLNGVTFAQEPQITQWEWVSASGTVLVAKGNNEADRNYKHTVAGTDSLYFVGYNKTGCSVRKKFVIIESEKLVVNLTPTNACGKTTLTATSVPSTGVVTYSWKYSNGADITSTGSSVTLSAPAYADGTVSVTGKTTTPGYCASDTVKMSVTIDLTSPPPTATTPLYYPVEAGNVDVSADADVQYDAGNTLYWRNSSGVLLTPPVLQSKSASGTYTFWVGQITPEGCRSDSIQIAVIISTVPPPEVRDTVICEGASLDLSILAETTEVGGSLSWYTNVDASKGTGSATPPTVSGTKGDYYYYVSQLVGSDESEKAPIKVTVLALPEIEKPADQTVCNGLPTAAVNLPGGATYSWTNSNTAIGLAATGTGNIAAFNATNSTNAAISGAIEITPTANGCKGNPVTFTITVNPTPTVDKPLDQTKCNNAATDEVNFTGNITAGATYSWTNSNPAIGLPASGDGDIASFTTTNSTNAPITGTITVTPMANNCTGSPVSFTITVNPTPMVTKPADQTKCNNAATDEVNFTGGVTCSWTNSNTAIGLPASGDGDITAFTATNLTNAAITGTITVTPTANGCPGTPASFTITVNPTPTVDEPSDQDVCNGAPITAINFTGNISAGVTYNWVNTNATIGLPASGDGDITAFITTNTTNAAISGTVTVTPTINGCPGSPESFSITVNPAPMINKPADQTKCNDATTDAVNFTGNMSSGVIYNWTNTNAAIGLPASGTGDIDPFTATNATNAPISGTITVTPTSTSSCPGVSTSFTITVNPTPTVNKPSDQTVCNNVATTAVNFTGNIAAGVTYNWVNTNAAIGLPASGTGNINPFTATNSTNAAITATITVTPTINSCTGTSTSFDFTIDPSPTVTKPADQTKCNDSATDAVNFTGNITGGVTYNWTNSNIAIGLPASGNGDIASFKAVNSTNTPITATITVTPTADGCPGTSTSFDITVDPTPTVTKPDDQTVCNNAATTEVNFTGNITGGVTYSWTNTNAAIGLATNGMGDVAPFAATNSTDAEISGTIEITPAFNGCQGTPASFTITVNPTPTVIKPADQTLCNDATTEAVNFTGNMTSGVTYNWENSNTAIGLPASGIGNIAVFTAANSTNAAITGTITVTPTANDCPGAPVSFTITVNPTPTVTKPADQTLCNGAMTIAVNFTGDIAGGVTYDWTNGNTDIGLAANGTGNIVSFKAINTEKTVTSATIAVVPTFNGCSGIAVSFTITVNPTPIIDGVTNNARCGTGSIVLNATASGGNINWYTSSTGGNPVHTGTAYSTPDITGTTDYWVEAVQNNCPSATRTKVTASINKLPTIDAGSAPVICEGESVDIHITPTPSSATIIWNDPTVTVNNAAGTFVTVEPPYKNGINHRSTYTYTVTARDGAGCEEDYPVTVMVDEKLKGGITANTPICEGFSATIDARSYNADTYIWTSTDFAGNKQIARIVESPEETAIYNLYIERGVCKAYDVITIEVNSKPVILMIDSIGVRDREIVFAPGYGTQPFKYGVDNQPADGNSVKNNLSFGKHAFYITDGTGCTSDMYDQSVEAPELFPPIYFSPNGDGVKDTWEVEGMREIYPDAVVTIYDRFGKQLTQYKGADTGWDGTYLGKQMPTTDYWYIIYIEIINKQYVGHFTLLRR